MNLKKYLLIGLTASAIIALNGCSSNGYSEAASTPGKTNEVLKRDSETDSGYTVIKQLKTRDVAGVLHASVTVVSTSSKDVGVEYQFTWFDKDGFATGNDMPWQPLAIYAGSTKEIQGVAPNTLAVSYKINLHVKQ